MISRRATAAFLSTALIAILTALPAGAAPKSLRLLPVQEGGRVKPFDTFARETMREIYGRESWQGHSATDVVFSMMEDGDTWKQKAVVRIDHLELKEKFAIGPGVKNKYYSFAELMEKGELISFCEMLRRSGRDDFNNLESAALEAYNKMVLVDLVTRRHVPHVLPPEERDAAWMSIGDLESAPFAGGIVRDWNGLQSLALGGDEAAIDAAVAAWRGDIEPRAGYSWVDDRRMGLEVAYNAVNPFQWAWIVYILAFTAFLVSWSFGNRLVGVAALFLMWGGFVLHTGGLLTRQYLAGRPPISNLYEATIFIAWGIVFMSILFEMANRKRIHGTVAAGLGTIALVLAQVLPIERELNPLVAVLRSYWMQYHVTTILLSYSALTLACGLAHFHLALNAFAPHRRPLARKVAGFLYTSMKIGVLMLAAGIILGAVWAAESWGRYWGWDPKETWALITLMGYVAILHGRFAGWLTPYGVSVANVACWGLVLFTYYGVNFFLVGLHSYAGAAEAVKLPPLLVAYLIFETAVVVAALWYKRSGRLSARAAGA